MLAEIEAKKEDMKNARIGMAQGIKYSSRSLGGHTTQYRRLCRLAGIKIDLPEIKKVRVVGKPCRYKACKGRNHKMHGEKCPVASARGKTGGKAGDGEVKQRLGSTNGNFKAVRECGCPMRQHRIDCSEARLSVQQQLRRYGAVKKAREVLNINPISWLDQAITTAGVSAMLHGVRGVCAGCSQSVSAIAAKKIHRADVMQNPARVICDACEA